MIQVYTGDGKGKTTAALGQALRAIGHGWKVLMIQFMKGDPTYGEVGAAKHLPNFDLLQYGLHTFVEKGNPSVDDLRLARDGFERAQRAVKSGKYRMIILDEINVAVDYGLLKLDEVLELVRACPSGVELILTGRYAHQKLKDAADLVSEVKEVKHPYVKGIVSREGIDY